MRMLVRNLTEFKYYKYTGLESDLDEDGLHTGVPRPVYEKPVTYKGNISVPSGSAVQGYEGLDIRYSHVLLMDDPDVDITETGKIMYKGRLYTITAVRPSLNVFSAALLADTANYGDQRILTTDTEDNGD